MTERLILCNYQSPGDIVMLTAAVRDLHKSHPGRFTTEVRTSCPALWEHNPYVVSSADTVPGRLVLCEYPLVHQSNQVPYHFIHGFRKDLERQLGVSIEPTAFHGDIHLSDEEYHWMSQVEETLGAGARFWIVVSGGKHDYTAKWWCARRMQEVVDHFDGRIQFVQVGEAGHHHPPLSGVLDLRGKTDLRQLVRLVHHSDGVVCPVTLLMHLAAAVPVRQDRGAHRPCVVVAGGREPSHWEAYPWHQYLHTTGMLSCCASGGCWRARVKPLGDGDAKDRPSALCVDVRGELPRCMDLITSSMVIERIELYLDGQVASGGPDCA